MPNNETSGNSCFKQQNLDVSEETQHSSGDKARRIPKYKQKYRVLYVNGIYLGKSSHTETLGSADRIKGILSAKP